MRTLEQKLTAYIDGELDAAETREVERLLEHDAAAREIVEEHRRVNEWARGISWPLEDEPGPPELVAFIDDLPHRAREISGERPAEPDPAAFRDAEIDQAPGRGKVVPFAESTPSTTTSWWSMAAAIAGLFIIGSAVLHSFDTQISELRTTQVGLEGQISTLTTEGQQLQQEVAATEQQIERLTSALAFAEATSSNAEASLLAAQARVEELEAVRADLDRRVETLTGDVADLTTTAERRQQELAAAEGRVDQLASLLADAEAARDAAQTNLVASEATIAELEGTRATLEGNVQQLMADVQAMNDVAEQRQERLAAIQVEAERLTTTLSATEAERDQARTDVEAAESTIQELQTARAGLEGQVEQLAASNQDRQEELRAAQAEIEGLDTALADAADTKREADVALARAQSEIDELRTARAGLEQEVAGLTAESAALADEIERRRGELISQETQIAQLMTGLVQADTARGEAETEVVAAQNTIETLQTTRAALEQRTAALEAEQETLLAEIGEKEAQLARAQGDQQQSARTLAASEKARSDAQTGLVTAQASMQRMQQALDELMSTSWPLFVAKYHQMYAGPDKPEMHWVEVPASEGDHLGAWLAQLLELAEPLPVPDLTEQGLDFLGGRPLMVNGMPAAQLMYLRADGLPVGFCLMRNMMGEEKARTRSSVGDLQMVDWRDENFQYIVVGWEPSTVIDDLAEDLEQDFRI